MAITHISFDLDGTLITLRGVEHKFWLNVVPNLYAEKEKISFKQAYDYCIGEYAKLGPDKAEWYDTDRWFNFFGFEQDWRETLTKLCQGAILLPNAKETLEKYSKTHSLVLFTNTNREGLEIKLNLTGIKKYFDHTISVSSDFNMAKTTPLAYEKLVDYLGIKKEEILHVGDFLLHDYHKKCCVLNLMLLIFCFS